MQSRTIHTYKYVYIYTYTHAYIQRIGFSEAELVHRVIHTVQNNTYIKIHIHIYIHTYTHAYIQRIGFSEVELVQKVIDGVSKLIEIETKLAEDAKVEFACPINAATHM